MSSAEESPAQRAARLRRERREAKIKESGAARLDKITSLSGRTPASVREEVLPSEAAQTPPSSQTPPRLQPLPSPMEPFPKIEDQSPESLQAQQDYFRALLRQRSSEPIQPQQADQDPMMNLLNSLMGGAGMPAGQPGIADGPDGASASPDLSIASIASALGVPPFLTKLLTAFTQPETAETKRQARIWTIVHVIFSVCLGVYLFILIKSSVATFGSPPPPPATAQNPWLIFLTGELVLSGGRYLAQRRVDNDGFLGLGALLQLIRDVKRDGSIILFMFGMASWWYGWQSKTSSKPS